MTEINQGLLVNTVKAIFPGETILQNVRSASGIKNPFSGHHLELDIWIPALSLSLEFQDFHHYATAWYAQSPLDVISLQDEAKRELSQQRDVTLIQVPCWWDGAAESLQETIASQRPDIICSQIQAKPIPLNPFRHFFPRKIPEVGELMLASLAQSHASFTIARGWWMGEKYDGFRFCWHPKRKALYSRSGERLYVPFRIGQCFPPLFLDGEVWYGRGQFPETQKIIHSLVHLIDWSFFRGICFDTADSVTNNISFEKRYKILVQEVPLSHPFIIPASRRFCAHKREFREAVAQIEGDEGEGIVLRLPDSIYEHGRSSNLLKIKASPRDQEALVLNVEHDKVALKLPVGTVFETNDVPLFPIHRGDVVTFTYTNFTRLSIPFRPNILATQQDAHFPVSFDPGPNDSTNALFRPNILRVRHDYPWKEAVRDNRGETFSAIKEEDLSLGDAWRQHTDRREFFVKFAQEAGFDPLVPHNWYSVAKHDLPPAKFSGILAMYDNDLRHALLHLFPEIGLRKSEFFSSENLQTSERRRQYFLTFARQNGFDPLHSDSWYNVTRNQVYSAKNSALVCSFHNGSFPQAIADLFPQHKIDLSKFAHFKPLSECEFLDQFAWHNHFDPRIPENWYTMGVKFRRTKNANAIIKKYGDYVQAVVTILDDITFDKSRFNDDLWRDVLHQRTYFCKFAEEMTSDFLEPRTWYSTTFLRILMQREGTRHILSHYGGDIARALQNAFPEIVFDPPAFSSPVHWQEKRNRKVFFEAFAQENEFDSLVPQNWYYASRKKFFATQNASHVLRHYRGSFAEALLDLYPEIGLQKNKLFANNSDFWAQTTNRKIFLDNFATKKSFDPLSSEHWRTVSAAEIKNMKNGRSLLAQCNGSVKQLVCSVYPSLKFS
eukprot:Phypoly_transcript_02028.p1 GENE.Phypoly_transcript_02028~~Phypoly_transcript_02028.p1  ORF type:complete len:915 (+),score=93.17 Phypoly_transcript_02028:73-2745(+)